MERTQNTKQPEEDLAKQLGRFQAKICQQRNPMCPRKRTQCPITFCHLMGTTHGRNGLHANAAKGFKVQLPGSLAWCACHGGLWEAHCHGFHRMSSFTGEETTFRKVQGTFPRVTKRTNGKAKNSILKVFAHSPMQYVTLLTDKRPIHQTGLFKSSQETRLSVVASANSLYQYK